MFGWLTGPRRASRRVTATVPEGVRVYAIGDIHGRRDLLDELLAAIEVDCATTLAQIQIVFLGDYVDRGPDSAQVIDRLVTAPPDFAACRFLAGNHEAAMAAVLDGDSSLMPQWLEYGGAATLESYGVNRREIAAGGLVLDEALARVPAAHRDFLGGLEDTAVIGDYVFVHAGIRPRVALARQDRRDLLSIRDEFLDDERDYGFMVVHGHTVTEAVEVRRNRIGIDTGAYQSGCLTALALEGTERYLLQTGLRQ